MTVIGAEAYPLQWPDGWPRTPSHRRESDNRFGISGGFTEEGRRVGRRITVGRARDQLMDELHRLGATDIVVSTNVPVKADGLLYADNKRLDDPGIAVYFTYKKKKFVMARDGFTSVAGNLRSLGLAIDGMRQLDRHGGRFMLEKAFEGFLALAPPNWKKPWCQVFSVKPEWQGDITALYREKARERHPDAGGNDTLMAELNVAYKEARQEGNNMREDPDDCHPQHAIQVTPASAGPSSTG